ncbi:MAG: VCBS repeat-containing protein [Planctomycetes bacterium]|nr:VCBS repeat-containing protein [Planctomycetota bacterium]
MLADLLLLASVALAPAPQSPPASETPALRLAFPAEPTAASFAPFVDVAGVPTAQAIRAAGADCDLDGDGNADAWFVAADGRLSVLLAQTAELGRFGPTPRVIPGGFADATAWHVGSAGAARWLVAVDPAQPFLWAVDLTVGPGQDPRQGTVAAQPTALLLGTDMVEIASADADHDGDDDLVVLREQRQGSTVVGALVDCLVFTRDPLLGWQHARTWSINLPVPCAGLAAGDLDGDGATDWAVGVPGYGVIAFAEGQGGGARFLGGVPLGGLPLRDLCIADATGDGRDDLVIALDAGVLIGARGAAGFALTALVSPAGTGALATALVLDADGQDGRPDVVAIPRDLQQLAVHRGDPTAPFGFATPWPLPIPANAGAPYASGGSSLGTAAAVADVDNDGDLDLLVQAPSADRWVTLAGATADLAPAFVHLAPAAPQAPSGFQRHELTVQLPTGLLAQGVDTVEVAALIEKAQPVGEDFEFWSRTVLPVDPQTGTVTLPIEIMMDPANVAWMRVAGFTSWLGAMTTGGDTILTIHAKQGPKRFASVVLRWDGDQGPNGSAVGVRWRVVAAPPLPKADADLLPWD